jgi:hypothetical protein
VACVLFASVQFVCIFVFIFIPCKLLKVCTGQIRDAPCNAASIGSQHLDHVNLMQLPLASHPHHYSQSKSYKFVTVCIENQQLLLVDSHGHVLRQWLIAQAGFQTQSKLQVLYSTVHSAQVQAGDSLG